MMCTAKIVRSMPMPICTVSGAYSVQPPAGRAAGHEERSDQQDRRGRQQPEADQLFMPRERHVGRADHHRDLPVREADERRHDRAEHHDQRRAAS